MGTSGLTGRILVILITSDHKQLCHRPSAFAFPDLFPWKDTSILQREMDSAIYAHYETGDYSPPEVILDDKEYGKALDTIVKGVPFLYNKMLSSCWLMSC